MEMRINKVLSSLEMGAEDVRMIGIKGMGGGGKTTLATAIFNQISNQFEGRSFVENVREVSKTSLSGLKDLQKQILTDVFSSQNITVSSVSGGKNMMVQMMRRKKVLVVLDDVNDTKQLEALAGASNWFKPGSRIIITTRDEQVLLAQRVNFNHNFIHEVNLLSAKESIVLFSRHAFGREIPDEGYEHLSRKVVQYAAGLPLTIKVLGSFLCDQKKPKWNNALERLKTIPLNETMMILELSYNSLEDDYKDIFLDVACLLKGWDKKDAIRALESCGFYAEVGLRVLEQRSLINISEDEKLGMHDHIEEMGKNIVRRVDPNKPERHSRLWIKKEIEDVLANGSATPTKCMTLYAHGLDIEILKKGLANMKELRFLDVYGGSWISRFLEEDSLHLPNALRFLRWDYYPFSSLPKTFQPNNLVGLEMNFSRMVKLWKDGEEKPFLKLRFLRFILCSKLRTLDLSVAPNLETLILQSCFSLVEVHFQVTSNLKELRIDFCKELEKLHMPAESPKLRSLDLYNLKKLRTLHLGVTPNLETLRVRDCPDLVDLQIIPAECPKLVLRNCFRLVELPEEIGRLECLKELDITGTRIGHLPQSIFRMKGLRIVGSIFIMAS
ncbi:toll/interleukin-1 receptor (TIR) domain-containing protein [Artemisia annua]|uniref:Toll/interleukin-1 receptor (TIR) domain-containing protein n=1 Tax=Artemisia annua TaxID=35608 RepID=A0A2U1M165_ARTAN|nr:toll/interleukin-1 receptor (TIR) domain-containing protein [Artemisia annua]